MKIENNVLIKVKDEDIVNGTIVIPDGVTEIANCAFLDCLELKNIVIPESVQSIGKQAFEGCKNLKSIKLPNDLKTIKSYAFRNCKSLTSIEIPDKITEIEQETFYGCSHLGNIKLSSNLKKIDREAFCYCSILPKIDLPESLESIEEGVFRDCRNLRSIVIPPKITKIPKNTFYYCHLKNITLPEGLTSIGDHAFFLCSELKHIKLPNSLTEIDNGAFKACYALKEITVPENVYRIGAEAFENCEGMTKITLPENLKRIGTDCFSGCHFLFSVNLPDSLESVGHGLFKHCIFLRNVHLPKDLAEIDKDMFYRCVSLREIDIPENVKVIGENAFNTCKHLKVVNLPEGLKEIKENAFIDCKSLSEIKLPSTLTTIQESAFQGCSKLRELNLPKGIENLSKNIIKDCKKIKSLYIPDSIKELKTPNDNYFSFVEKTDDGFVVLNKPGTDSYLIDSIKVKIPFFFKYKDMNPSLLNEQKNETIADFYNTFAGNLSEEQLESFMKSHNFTFFKQIMKQKPAPGFIDRFNKMGFYTGLYNLGAFNTPEKYNGKNIDYAQKVVGRLLDYIDKGNSSTYDKLSNSFVGMDIDGFKKEFTDFYLEKLFEIMKENSYNEEFLARAYNEFEEVQATNTNDRGSQRQLKPTVEKFKNYFKSNKFRHITPETQEIADTISRYFDKQENFEKAVEIMNEFKENNVPKNILSRPLSQENTPFKYIDKTAEKIEELQEEMLGDLSKIATNEFTYEWLEKNDPQNLILGKLCSCCAHLHGAGFGIMRASIIHPSVQNLVVRDEVGRIIAKSTLFVNQDKQYGVLNNFEVYQGLPYLQYKEVYRRFMQGVSDFANQYNIEHPDKPLKQITVGACHNDLLNYVRKANEPSRHLLKALDYEDYGYDAFTYNGDSFAEQYVVWKNNEPKKAKTSKNEIEKQS